MNDSYINFGPLLREECDTKWIFKWGTAFSEEANSLVTR